MMYVLYDGTPMLRLPDGTGLSREDRLHWSKPLRKAAADLKRPECLPCVRMGELDQSWFDRNPEYRSAAGPVDLDDRGDSGEDPYIGLADMWNGTPQRDEWGRMGCHAWAIDRLMEAA